MAEEGQEAQKKATKPLTFANLTALAQALDSEQAHTSFGKLPLSVEKTAAQFSFSQANRWDGSKVFVNELTKNENIGKNAPGPQYKYDDKIKYGEPPRQAFSQAVRMAEEKPKYDFYENNLFLDDPIQADLNRKKRQCPPKIGTEPRMQANNLEQVPGPQYYPKEKPELAQAARYTFGYRRGGGGLKNDTSTPASVGPGRYAPEYSVNTSDKRTMPRWTLPKAAPREAVQKKFDKHQTYDTRSGFGPQNVSKNRTTTQCHFGTSGRDHTKKLGTFKDTMQGGSSVKCYMPKW